MSTLAEIERAAAALPPEQKQELMLFPGARLRGDNAMTGGNFHRRARGGLAALGRQP